jgi:hypothetical protein
MVPCKVLAPRQTRRRLFDRRSILATERRLRLKRALLARLQADEPRPRPCLTYAIVIELCSLFFLRRVPAFLLFG